MKSTHLFSAILLGAVCYLAPATNPASASEDLFAELRGNWGGSGTMSLSGGRTERLTCRAKYSGTESQLRLMIDCKSSKNDIQMSAKLSANSGKLLGTWEEKTFKAIGTISGTATQNKIKFYIGGNVLGTMAVTYSKNKQDVLIKTAGISLQDVRMKLSRR